MEVEKREEEKRQAQLQHILEQERKRAQEEFRTRSEEEKQKNDQMRL